MISNVLYFIATPFRVIPWYLWWGAVAVAAWFGRGILLIAATIVVFHPIPIPPLFQGEPATRAEAQLQDLQHFNHVRRNERSMTNEMRVKFDNTVEELKMDAGELTDAEFVLGLARAQAVINNAHSNASATRLVEPFPRLPLRTTFFEGELRVLRTLNGYEDLLGARVTHINGETVEVVIKRFRDVFGGTDIYFRKSVPLLLETPDFLNAVGLGETKTRLRLELFDGTIVERALQTVAPEENASRISPGELPLTWTGESDAWVAFAPVGNPLYLRQPDRGYWIEEMPELDAAYVNIRMNYDDDSGEALRDFSKRAIAELRVLSPKVIIIDHRFNAGGDFGRTQPLMAALGEIVGADGRIYLLVSPNTFSAGIVNLAFAKQGAPDQTILIGEEISDRLQFWAEGWTYHLSNSNFRARYSTAFYDLQNGCKGLFRCYWGSLHLMPVLVDDLDVDIAAPLTFDAYAAGQDPALNAVVAAEKNVINNTLDYLKP